MMIYSVLEEPREYNVIDYDGLWKKLIYELFEEFILYFAADLSEEIDFLKDPEFLQQELFQEIIHEKKGKNVADQIVKVFLKNGEEKWILIHIEVQGDYDPGFSKRMFQYYYRILDKYNQDICAIALLTDGSKSFRPNQYHRSYHGTELMYKYNIYKFSDQVENELLLSSNPFALAVLAGKFANEAKNDAEKRYRFKRKLIKLVLQKNNNPQEEQRIYISTLIYFIDYLLQLPKELTQKLRNEIILSKEMETMYLDRKNLPLTFGELMKLERDEGKEEGKRKVARRMLIEGFPVELVSKLTDLSEEEIRKL